MIFAVVVRLLTGRSVPEHRAAANQGHNGAVLSAGLQFGVLGPLQLIADGNPVPLGAPKQRAVLAMLVVNRNRPVSVDSLINAVWDQSPVPAARTSIHSYVSNLRRLLGGAGYDPNKVLASAPPGYQLSVDDSNCDGGTLSTSGCDGSAGPPGV